LNAIAKRPVTLPRMNPENIPSEGQVLCLRAFARLKNRLHRVPSLAEISEEMQLTSRNGCQTHMRILEEKGLITPCTLVKTKGVITKHQDVTKAGLQWL